MSGIEAVCNIRSPAARACRATSDESVSNTPGRSFVARVRKEIDSRPDTVKKFAKRCMARACPFPSRCIQTAEQRMASKADCKAPTRRSSGSASCNQVIRGEGCKRLPISRKACDGSTAMTSCPRSASADASRPDPAPTSSIKAGLAGRKLKIGLCTCSNVSASYLDVSSCALAL